MPFVSKKQMRLCYLLQKKGSNKGWNCKEWSEKTDYTKLPEKVTTVKRRSRSRSRSKRKSKSKK